MYNSHNRKGVKRMTRLHLGLSHLCEHKFKHSFQNLINPLCNCDYEAEFTVQFFLHFPLFIDERSTLFNFLGNLNSKLCSPLGNLNIKLFENRVIVMALQGEVKC